MFDKHCDYALNRLDQEAIVCQSVTGDPIRLTPDQFSSVEEFERWKAWSDADYHKIQLAGRGDDDCLSFSEQLDAIVPSAEDVFFAPLLREERREKAASLLAQVKAILTETQHRRLWKSCVEKKTVIQIAQEENVTEPSVSESITRAREKIFKKFS